MTLTDFILERIAEDEKLRANLPSVDSLIAARNAQAITMRDAQAVLAIKHRLRSEIEAKRRIAEHADDKCLRMLALSYADHPDYRQEWKTR